jgi:hypothetical protein
MHWWDMKDRRLLKIRYPMDFWTNNPCSSSSCCSKLRNVWASTNFHVSTAPGYPPTTDPVTVGRRSFGYRRICQSTHYAQPTCDTIYWPSHYHTNHNMCIDRLEQWGTVRGSAQIASCWLDRIQPKLIVRQTIQEPSHHNGKSVFWRQVCTCTAQVALSHRLIADKIRRTF